EYGIRLDEKQKMKSMYGVLERQFRRYFHMAQKKRTGVTGEVLINILESRLDNIVYRMGFATSRSSARLLVKHRFVDVGGRCVDVPSYIVKPGQVVKIRGKGKEKEHIKKSMDFAQEKGIFPWLEVAADKLEGKFLRIPERNELPLDIKEQFIVEFYSR
ncbi:MAG: 30S ribosomal protein S4, partial [Nitrospirae bacterium RIFOXYC2_FULL_44_7]